MKFELTSDEGLPLRGDFDVPRNARALIIVVHGFKGFKDWGFFPWLAEHLCSHRFVVCRFNMSRSGIGENPESFDRLDLFAEDTYSRQVADLQTVAKYAQSQFSGLPTFLLGHSRGGGVALLSARGIPSLAGVVTWSAIARADRWDEPTKREWRARGSMDVVNARTGQVMKMSTAILEDFEANRHDILEAASMLRVPLLALHGKRDESVPPEESEQLVARLTDASHVVIENASHTYNASHPLLTLPLALTLAAEISARFIGGYC
ncbi:MAG: alpha/beta fold hydrolase [Acidobacteriota bacterium]